MERLTIKGYFMSQKNVKKYKKKIRKEQVRLIKDFLEEVKKQPFGKRFRLAYSILFPKKRKVKK